ncbi:ParB/RepB/Spo0J family partition protein [Streptomyces tirandamycinicus]|uniref:ParB/RepB/Spo0J family partition protein n=1 Tax=Streptomyces tirandamycinicus TaxID=2174846 RepID=UPI00142D69E1|nr:ParB/RepB/Spo0J family partition protein [Streptomyces tirandamycinicus]
MAGNLKRAKRNSSGGGANVPSPSTEANAAFYALPPTEADGEALSIELSDISANPFNDRDTGDVTNLAESIKKDGLLQDVSVIHASVFTECYPEVEGITTKYVLAFGERRWRAHQAAGLSHISAVLRNDVAPKIRRVLFVENFHRKQLSPMEEARRFYRMNTEEGMSYREIVEELSLGGPNHVSRRIELLKLPAALQDVVGTDEGPGVTLARDILGKFAEPENQIRAWELIRDEEISLGEAVQRIHGGDGVPQGNDVPIQRTAEPAASPAPASGAEETPASDEKTATGKKPKTQTPQPKIIAADKDTAHRNNASADRESACKHLVGLGAKLTAEQQDALFARALLANTQQAPARTRAHRWLREASQAEFTISDTDSYFEAVLSSGKDDLINRVAFVTALAAGEVRARDGRRQWDRTDADHVRLLIEVGNYHPQTGWERAQLTKFGVPFPGADEEPDADPIS